MCCSKKGSRTFDRTQKETFDLRTSSISEDECSVKWVGSCNSCVIPNCWHYDHIFLLPSAVKSLILKSPVIMIATALSSEFRFV